MTAYLNVCYVICCVKWLPWFWFIRLLDCLRFIKRFPISKRRLWNVAIYCCRNSWRCRDLWRLVSRFVWWVSRFVTKIVAICDVKICIFTTYIHSICMDILFIRFTCTNRRLFISRLSLLGASNICGFVFSQLINIPVINQAMHLNLIDFVYPMQSRYFLSNIFKHTHTNASRNKNTMLYRNAIYRGIIQV